MTELTLPGVAGLWNLLVAALLVKKRGGEEEGGAEGMGE